MNTIQFIGTSPADLIKGIKEALIPQLKAELSQEFQSKQPTEYLTRDEVCSLLKIDLSTLYLWTKRGDIQAYGMGNRVYYKRHEIEQKLNDNQITASLNNGK